MSADFFCEEKLLRLDPSLHKKYCGSVCVLVRLLTKYRAVFPDYTDHSYLHTMNVLELCNKLIGDNAEKLNCGEIYVLIMAAALHDTGMGISERDYEEFISEERFKEYLQRNHGVPKQQIIRDLHHELSGCFIKKYSELFDIPEEFVFPIIQTARGHRLTDLTDRTEYPIKYPAGRYIICLPYLSAVLRLADELDISAERNIRLDRSADEIKNTYSLSVWQLHSAIKDIFLTDKECIIYADKSGLSEFEIEELSRWISKLEKVIEYTSDVVQSRTEFEMYRRSVTLKYV